MPASTATRRCCHELTSRRVCRRGAPRRWYDNGGSSLSATSTAHLFGVRRAVTRFGVVTAEVHSASCPAAGSSAGANCAEAVQLSLSVEVTGGPPDQPVDVPTPLNESRLRIASHHCSRSITMRLFRNVLAENFEPLLGFPTILRWGQFSVRINWKRIVRQPTRRSRYTLVYAPHTTTRRLYGQSSTASTLVWRG